MDANAYVAAEAVNLMAEILHQDFLSIELKQPPQNIKANLDKLTSLMKELNNTYRKVIAYASPRSFEATFNIAKTFEEFADKYISQEIDPNLNPDQKFVAQLKINEQGYKLYDRAVEEYKTVIKAIPALAEKLGIDLTQPDTTRVAANADSSTNVLVMRVAEIDSARQLAIKWHEKAKVKFLNYYLKKQKLQPLASIIL